MNATNNSITRLLRLAGAAVVNGSRKLIRWATTTALRVVYVVGLIVFNFGGLQAFVFVGTHQTSDLVSGIVIAALGAALSVLANIGYRRLPNAQRHLVFRNAERSWKTDIVAAAILAASGGLQVWLALTPDGGSIAPPLAVLLFALAARGLVAARRKRRLSSPESGYRRDIRALQMDSYVRTKPRPAPQLGADGLGGKYGGGGWLGF